MHITHNTIRACIAACGAWLWAALQPAAPHAAVCTLMIFADVVTARRLARRLSRRHPEARQRLRFSSARLGRAIRTLLTTYAVLALAALLQYVVVQDTFPLLRLASGAICFWQAVSILENEAACNRSPWARILRSILIDKAERYLNVSLPKHL